MSGDSWANVRVSGVTLEVPAAKDLLENKGYRWLRFWEGRAVDSDIPDISLQNTNKGMIMMSSQ